MENRTIETVDTQEWPRDFDFRVEVAEQAELVESDEAPE